MLVFLNIPSVCVPFHFLLSEVVQQHSHIVCVSWPDSSDTFEADAWRSNGGILPTGRESILTSFLGLTQEKLIKGYQMLICFVYYKNQYLECIFLYLLFSELYLVLCFGTEMSLPDHMYNLNSVIFLVLKGHRPDHSSKKVLAIADY